MVYIIMCSPWVLVAAMLTQLQIKLVRITGAC